MTTAQGEYTPVHPWVKHVLGRVHTTTLATVAWAVRCLLMAQRVTPAALARAFSGEHAGSGRSCLRRVRRWWRGPALKQLTMSPGLIRMALTLWPAGHAVVVARDTTRLGPWEVWLAGIVVAGRPRPIGWAVIPSPWPKGRLRTTPVALIPRLQAACPSGGCWPVVAERGFPRALLFAQLCHGGTGFRVRLRLRDWGTVAGRLYDGRDARGGGPVGGRAADHRSHGPWASRATTGAGLGRGERFVLFWADEVLQ